MSKYRCTICNWIYDETKEGKTFEKVSDDFFCPVCNAKQNAFVLLSKESGKVKIAGRTVSDVFIDQISEWGVKYVFGLPGTSSLGLVDACRKNSKITYIQVRHEQTAAFMAGAYGKLTGHIAACLTIAGPGATNLATGLYDAKLDNAPVLALTGLAPRETIGQKSFQEIDQHSFFEPITVFNEVLMSKEQTNSLATLAIKHALLKKGVSHISFPNDIQKLPYNEKILPFEGRIANKSVTPCSHMIRKAAMVIDKSKKPVIIAGYGAMGFGHYVKELAEKIGAPIVTTFRAKGIIDEIDNFCAGCHGGIGTLAATTMVQESDLLIVLGASYAPHTLLPEKKTVQIDIDAMALGKKYPVEVGLWGNITESLPKLIRELKTKDNKQTLLKMLRLKKNWEIQLNKEADSSKKPIKPQYIIKMLSHLLPDDAVISLDVGDNSWWFGRNFQMKHTQKMIMTGYLAAMGPGFPGAMVAKLVYPNREAVCITGDGGFAMVMGDFMTAVKNKLNVKIFIFNNKQFGMIRQEQKIEKYQNWQTDLLNCDFAKFAENCGGIGIKVTEPLKLEAAIKKALSINQPVIVDIDTDPNRF